MRSARDWTQPLAKVGREGCCRVCGTTNMLTPAHLWARGLGGTEDEENIIPLCLPCHRLFDSGDFDLGPHITLSEKLKVVELAEIHGHRDGLNAAHERLFPSAHPLKRVAA